ncbi:MAG: Y-family DNA polymerase [Planctomycetota bacterium]
MIAPNAMQPLQRRMLAVAFPRWSAECARRTARRQGVAIGSETAVLVIAESHGARIVHDCCSGAAAIGVLRGMSLVQARAICSGARVELPHVPERDASMLRACAVWCQRFSPITMMEPSAGMPVVLIDITGCERIHPSEPALEQRVRHAMRARGFTARIACAANAAAAVALATARRTPNAPRTLEACPVRSLRIERKVIERMHEVNIRRVGDLLRCTRASLASRFGAHTLRRLDQAFGRAVQHIEPVRPRPLPVAERTFDGPVAALDVLQISMQELIGAVCVQLHALERGAREIELAADCADAPRWTRRLVFGAPSANARHMSGMLAPSLEGMKAGLGVERLRLAVLRMGRMMRQEAIGEWVDTLCARLGADAVLRCGLVEDHRPRRASRWLPVLRHGFDARATTQALRARVVQAWRPSLLLRRAEAAAVTLGSGGSVRWRGDSHAVHAWHGPERIAPPWTATAALAPDEGGDFWRAQCDDGQWLWLRRTRDGWTVLGVWS